MEEAEAEAQAALAGSMALADKTIEKPTQVLAAEAADKVNLFDSPAEDDRCAAQQREADMHTDRREEQTVDTSQHLDFARSHSGDIRDCIAVLARTPPGLAPDRTHTAADHSHTVDTEGHCFDHDTAR